MSDILEIPTTQVSYLKFSSDENSRPIHISISEEGYIAILYPTSVIIGVIECKRLADNKKYFLNEDKTEIDFGFVNIFNVSDLNFKKSIDDKIIEDNVITNFLINESVTSAKNSILFESFSSLEWSPMNVFASKSYLALQRFDGRIIILAQNRTTNLWLKEFDLTDLYFKHYKEKFLESEIENGVVNCKDAVEYIKLKSDIKLVDCSWSMLVRQYKSQHYCLIVTLSVSGIITIWRIIADQKDSSCEHFYTEHLNLKGIRPLNVKFCDISDTTFLLTIIDFRDLVTAFSYSIVTDDEGLSVKILCAPFILNQQMKHCQLTKIYWSMKLSQLIVGFEWKLLVAKVINVGNGEFDSESAIIYLPSSSEISGLAVKDSVVYITSSDGFLFGIRLSVNVTSLELTQIIFKSPELNGNNEFYDVFVSPNSVYMGFLKISVDNVSRPVRYSASVAMVCLMAESQTLSVLMDDNIPFGRKQDAVEEMKYLYSNKVNHLQDSLRKIGNSDIQWGHSGLHRLQLIRYICLFFGYRLNIDSCNLTDNREDVSKIRKLESIIIVKNISYWLDGFCEMNNLEITREDCIFILKVAGKLSLLTENYISETIDAVDNKAITVLKSRFNIDELTIQRYKDVNKDIICPTCSEKCEFNLFSLKCSKNHVFARCCKTLELCNKNIKLCHMCGAKERFIEIKDLSNWRLEIVNSSCPLCDGKLWNVNC